MPEQAQPVDETNTVDPAQNASRLQPADGVPTQSGSTPQAAGATYAVSGPHDLAPQHSAPQHSASPRPVSERLPPQNLEAEMCLLGAMMLSREAVGEIIPIIGKPDVRWFYRPDHRTLFETLVDIYDKNEPIDLVVLSNELRRRNQLTAVGGSDYIVRCAESVPSAVHAEHYARIVRDKGMLRDLIGCAGEITDDAFSHAEDAATLLDRAEQRLFAVTERRISGSATELSELVRPIYQRIIDGDPNDLVGLPSGFSELDELTTGFQPGDLIVIAARPSMGKTALALNIAEHLTAVEKRAAVFFSMEMSREQVAQRMLCSRGRIDAQRFRKRMLNDEEKRDFADTCEELANAPLLIDDTPGMSPMELRAKARRLKAQKNIEIVLVDYLQLMHVPGAESRQQEVSEISRGLKALGRELNVPIIAMAQLNRMVEGRTGNEPRMSDLRESGAIEQDADVVILIHREEYYKRDDPNLKGKADLIIAKQRNGPTGKITLTFNSHVTRFDNYSPLSDSGYGGNAPF
ncbi:MAG: replicative DNA helicase [Planctomycetes bacterium]|nr:replicative DNA helicase [Planctomycetota bacterium]